MFEQNDLKNKKILISIIHSKESNSQPGHFQPGAEVDKWTAWLRLSGCRYYFTGFRIGAGVFPGG